MAGRVHLVRHGEVHNPGHVVYASLPGYRLSDTGVAQAQAVGRYLRSAPIVAVWSSPLERAIATAESIATHHDLPILVDEALTEWRMADDWAGIAWEELPTERPGELEAYLEHPLDLPFARESLQALAGRMRAAVTALAERYDGDVAVVSHQDPVQAARLSLTGRDLASQHRDKPEHGTVVTLKPGTPWTELTAWAPEQAEQFPPLGSPGRHLDPEVDTEEFGVGVERQDG
jgi:broad specificity phosphatase PhoE